LSKYELLQEQKMPVKLKFLSMVAPFFVKSNYFKVWFFILSNILPWDYYYLYSTFRL